MVFSRFNHFSIVNVPQIYKNITDYVVTKTRTPTGTHLNCVSPPNAVGDSTLQVNLLDATNDKCGQILPPKQPACLKYESPVVYKIQPSKGPVHGGATMMVEGKFLGKDSMKTDILIGSVRSVRLFPSFQFFMFQLRDSKTSITHHSNTNTGTLQENRACLRVLVTM